MITRFLVLRLGGAIDSNAIPDRTVRRENQDALKATVAVGFGVHFWKIFVDGAFELLIPDVRRASSRRRYRAWPPRRTRPASIRRSSYRGIVGSNTFLVSQFPSLSPPFLDAAALI